MVLVTDKNRSELWQWLLDTEPEMASHIKYFKKVFGPFDAVAIGKREKEDDDGIST